MATIEERIHSKPLTDPYHRAALNIMYTSGWLQYGLNTALKPLGLTEPQYNVLRILRGQNGAAISQQDIQSRMLQKMSNVSRLIDKLLEKKLTERKECKANRRQVEVFITAEGLALLEQADKLMEGHLKKAFANTSPEDAAYLNRLLDNIR